MLLIFLFIFRPCFVFHSIFVGSVVLSGVTPAMHHSVHLLHSHPEPMTISVCACVCVERSFTSLLPINYTALCKQIRAWIWIPAHPSPAETKPEQWKEQQRPFFLSTHQRLISDKETRRRLYEQLLLAATAAFSTSQAELW